jgi:SAM-dependent methyltransferase
MNMQIPWWGRIGAKLLLSRLPFGYSSWQSLGLFRHGQMDISEYAIRIFDRHTEKAGLTNNLNGKSILELGPGDSIATAVIANAHGANAILVDTGAYVRTDIDPYLELKTDLANKGLSSPNLSKCRTIDDLLAICSAKYMTAGIDSLAQIESASIDFIFSQAVLEHVKKKEFRKIMQECRRILKPNGICSHQIDLRDHVGGSLNNLRFNEQVWESELFARSGFYTNRLRYNQLLQLFFNVGFSVEVTELRRWEVLPIRRCFLSSEFKTLSEEELSVSGFHVLLR